MSDENEILDENFDTPKEDPKKKFNYKQYTFSYIFLMFAIGMLVSKITTDFNLKPFYLLIGSVVYIFYGVITSLLYEIITYLYRQLISKNPNKRDTHPTWFRMLETCFYAWCVIIFITYLGNKVF
jgi:hypothetical protein